MIAIGATPSYAAPPVDPWLKDAAQSVFADAGFPVTAVRVCDRGRISDDTEAVLLKADNSSPEYGNTQAAMVRVAVVKKDAAVPLFILKDLNLSYYNEGPMPRFERLTRSVITLPQEGDMYGLVRKKLNIFFDLANRKELARHQYDHFAFQDVVVYQDVVYALISNQGIWSAAVPPAGEAPAFRCLASLPLPESGQGAVPVATLHDFEKAYGFDGENWAQLATDKASNRQGHEIVLNRCNTTKSEMTVAFDGKESASPAFIVSRNNEVKRYAIPLPSNQTISKLKTRFFPDYLPDYSIEGIERVGSRLLFGLGFYNSEGSSGVGGFGWFDTTKFAYTMVYRKELADYSNFPVTQTENYVWIGLSDSPEGASTPAGLARYDLHAKTIKKYPVPEVINKICVHGKDVYCATEDGIFIVRPNGIIECRATLDEAGKPVMWSRPLRQ